MFTQPDKPNPLAELDGEVTEEVLKDVPEKADTRDAPEEYYFSVFRNWMTEFESSIKTIVNASFHNKRQHQAVLQLVQREFDSLFNKLN